MAFSSELNIQQAIDDSAFSLFHWTLIILGFLIMANFFLCHFRHLLVGVAYDCTYKYMLTNPTHYYDVEITRPRHAICTDTV